MSAVETLNVVLWTVQGFLCLFFLASGLPKLLGRGLERWTGFTDLPRTVVVTIGLADTFGALGVVAPMAADVLPWLTPLAALGLGITVLMAVGFHLRTDERLPALETGLLASVAACVTVGRLDLIVPAAEVAHPWLLSTAAGVLLISAITVLVIAYTRPETSNAPESVRPAQSTPR